MTTGELIVGRAVGTLIVWTPAPGMLNEIVSSPACALASRIACRSDPAPESFVLTTVNVSAAAAAAIARIAEATAARAGCRVLVRGDMDPPFSNPRALHRARSGRRPPSGMPITREPPENR